MSSTGSRAGLALIPEMHFETISPQISVGQLLNLSGIPLLCSSVFDPADNGRQPLRFQRLTCGV